MKNTVYITGRTNYCTLHSSRKIHFVISFKMWKPVPTSTIKHFHFCTFRYDLLF